MALIKTDDLPFGVFTLDDEGRVLSWNRSMTEITSMKEDETLGRQIGILEFYTDRGMTRPVNWRECMERNGMYSNSLYIASPGGESRLIFFQARKMEAGGVICCVGDISRIMVCEFMTNDQEPQEPHRFHKIVGKDKKMQEIYRMITLAAESRANIFIAGESGTGKELVARAVHNQSERKDQPFIAVNCSALSESLLESELFGHVKGAFTGAYKDKVGKFEAAHKGTIFLDEIGDISLAIQLKLLRVIQEKSIVRVGSNEETKVDMRIITATNKDMRALVGSGEFREDLFYRLKVFTINTIPLRDRPGDIPLLCQHFINHFNRETGKAVRRFSEDAYRLVLNYCWPGNVRELENAIEHAFVICKGEQIDIFDLPQEIRMAKYTAQACAAFTSSPEEPDSEKERLLQLLARNEGNKTRAARELGISRVGLWKRLKRLGIEE